MSRIPAGRLIAVAVTLSLMAGFGLGVYHALGAFKTDTTRPPTEPTKSHPAFGLPGTIYVSQGGALYRLRGTDFTRLTASDGWMQPALLPDGSLVAVKRAANFSDLYIVSATGQVVRQLTHDQGGQIDENQWVFFPRPTADGTSVYYAYDSPKAGYRVDLAIWNMRLAGKGAPARWTTPNDYTGGDVTPQPLPGGGILYAAYGIGDNLSIVSRIYMVSPPARSWLAPRQGPPLTTNADDCAWPTVSPDGRSVALICTSGQTTKLEVAGFDGTTLGPLRVLVGDAQVAAPTWAPDGSGIAYLAPSATGGGFQLWWLEGAAGPAPKPPKQVTTGLAFDATSPPAWSPT